jgi:hypothetical protein
MYTLRLGLQVVTEEQSCSGFMVAPYSLVMLVSSRMTTQLKHGQL